MNDPFVALLAENHLTPDSELATQAPQGFRVAVVVAGAALGPLPGSPRLYILVAKDGAFQTEAVIDLLELGLGSEPVESLGPEAVARFLAGLRTLLSRLRGVDFLAAKKFSGILPHRLLGLDIGYLVEGDWGLAGLNEAVNAALSQEMAAAPPAALATQPQLVGPGRYFLDLAKALALDPELSSKKILQPFLRETRFQELAIECDHQPRWLPEAARNLGLSLTLASSPGGVLVTLSRARET
ncbi:MAG: hypothetical protein LBR11_09150 [Deltaproteobacteria bacterium]|jgi:hypothetical protein|nr:hypothetical protein [Deltaproteobacteria bacterium]